jgi:signal transduction histidine kinase
MLIFLRSIFGVAIVVVLLGLFPCSDLLAQDIHLTTVSQNFTTTFITPRLLRDSARTLDIELIRSTAVDTRFWPAESPYLTFGADLSAWWLKFRVKNELKTPKTLILWLNRKNFDEFKLWHQKPDSTLIAYTEVGAKHYDDAHFALTTGYYIPVTLYPGENVFWAKASNEVGSMYLGLSLHTPDEFGLMTRKNVLLFGLFLGVMLVSLVFAGQLYFMYRDPTYLLYIAYVVVVLLREAYNHSAVVNLFPVMQRHSISFLMVATYGMFYRYFIRLWEINKWLDTITKWYLAAMFVLVGLFTILVSYEQGPILKIMFTAVMLSILIITALSAWIVISNFNKNPRARIVAIAFVPLAGAFILNLLRNIDIIPNYPFIQYAVMWGFILEVLVFTVAFIRWHAVVESDRNILEIKLDVGQKEKAIAVQAAEQRVKDRIARDLHDDIAASMSGIRILSKVAHQQFADKIPEAGPILEQISKSAQSTVESISDLIWSVKPHPDFLNDMADRLREYAGKVLESQDIDYKINIPRNLPILDLDIEARRNIYLLFKEAINNAVKHSQCSKLTIQLDASKEAISLLVSDNGVGFNPKTKKESGVGIGLNNMNKRAREIGGTLKIESEPGKGTAISFFLNLAEM